MPGVLKFSWSIQAGFTTEDKTQSSPIVLARNVFLDFNKDEREEIL